MAHDSIYEYDIHPEFHDTALIKLRRNVTGGDEAFGFTTALMDISSKNVSKVVINMSNVEIINSSGLGMLVSGLSTLKKKNIDMLLIEVPEKVMSLLKMTHLDMVFKIYSDLDSALKI